MSTDSDETFIPYWMMKETGVYDVRSSGNKNLDWWKNINVVMKNGMLWFINPENNKLSPVKGMPGWEFRKSKGA
jgi:hypothetical protein